MRSWLADEAEPLLLRRGHVRLERVQPLELPTQLAQAAEASKAQAESTEAGDHSVMLPGFIARP